MNTRMKTLMLVVVILTLVLAAEVARAEITFGTAINLGPMVNSADQEGSPNISADGLELYFNSNRPGGSGGADIWVSKRATTDDEWGEAVNLGPIANSAANEIAPSISADGLALYFCDWGVPRPGGFGKSDLWVTTRATKDDPWEEPVNLGPMVNSSEQDGTPVISANGLELHFESDRPGGFGSDDILVTKRATTEDDWGEPVNLGSTINTAEWEHCPNISSDGLTLFFDLAIPGYLIVTTRATPDADWSEPVNLGNEESDHYASSISADGTTLYFASKHPGGSGGNDIWQMPVQIE